MHFTLCFTPSIKISSDDGVGGPGSGYEVFHFYATGSQTVIHLNCTLILVTIFTPKAENSGYIILKSV